MRRRHLLGLNAARSQHQQAEQQRENTGRNPCFHNFTVRSRRASRNPTTQNATPNALSTDSTRGRTNLARNNQDHKSRDEYANESAQGCCRGARPGGVPELSSAKVCSAACGGPGGAAFGSSATLLSYAASYAYASYSVTSPKSAACAPICSRSPTTTICAFAESKYARAALSTSSAVSARMRSRYVSR